MEVAFPDTPSGGIIHSFRGMTRVCHPRRLLIYFREMEITLLESSASNEDPSPSAPAATRGIRTNTLILHVFARLSKKVLQFWYPVLKGNVEIPEENEGFGARSAPDFYRFGHPVMKETLGNP